MALTPQQQTGLRDACEAIARPINDWLLADAARRIAEAGKMTSTAAYQLYRAKAMGESQRALKKYLKRQLKLSNKEIRRLFRRAARYARDNDYQRLGVTFELGLDADLEQMAAAAIKLAQRDFTNLTQTLGMVDRNGRAQPLRRFYRESMDFAFEQVFTGAADYETAIRTAANKMAAAGVRVIDYESGVHTGLEAATRRNMMGGMGLMVEQITERNHDKLGCNGWEINAHNNSAPDHEPYQGRQFSDAEFARLNGSAEKPGQLKRRIGTLNCGHAAFPIILGIHSPQYTDEELEEMRRRNAEGVTWQGKHYTGYEATQKQRQIERSIRAQKNRILVAEAAGDAKALQTAQIRLHQLQLQYDAFSRGVGLRTQEQRLWVSGFGRAGAARKAAATKAASPKTAVKNTTSASVPVNPPTTPTPAARFVDITGKWYPEAIPNSHAVQDLQEYTVNGTAYKVDGHNVVLDYSPHEKEIAELLEREVGGEICMVPRVNNPQGVSTPDYLFHGKGYDLKTIQPGAGENTIFNRVKKKQNQACNFIIDVTETDLSDQIIANQIEKIFWSKNTEFVDEIAIIRNGKIFRVAKRI